MISHDQEHNFLSGPSPQWELMPVSLEMGEKLMDRFRIENHLGDGRFGSVYLAEDELRSMKVALKLVDSGPASEDIWALHLQREMSTQSRVSDFRYVVKPYDLHSVPWGATTLGVLSMEYTEGGTFRAWLVDRRQDLEGRRTAGMEFFLQACRGVGSVHEAGVVHLDLKPENLLFSDGLLKVSDFGAASCCQMSQESSNPHWEISPSELATPAYMSPEHFAAGHPDDLDTRSDIYSLGIILYELLNSKGRPPFGGSAHRLRELHCEVQAPRLTEAGEKLAGVVARCLKKNPGDRYESVAELIVELEEKPGNKTQQGKGKAASSNQTKKKVRELWKGAKVRRELGGYDDAMVFAERILDVQPDHRKALQLREELLAKSRQAEEFYREIEPELESASLLQLFEYARKLGKIYPDHRLQQSIRYTILARVHVSETSREFKEKWDREHEGEELDVLVYDPDTESITRL